MLLSPPDAYVFNVTYQLGDDGRDRELEMSYLFSLVFASPPGWIGVQDFNAVETVPQFYSLLNIPQASVFTQENGGDYFTINKYFYKVDLGTFDSSNEKSAKMPLYGRGLKSLNAGGMIVMTTSNIEQTLTTLGTEYAIEKGGGSQNYKDVLQSFEVRSKLYFVENIGRDAGSVSTSFKRGDQRIVILIGTVMSEIIGQLDLKYKAFFSSVIFLSRNVFGIRRGIWGPDDF
ncbi:MAG: hypothetical protein EZS28_006564 [Streblomastix strix]|uniref:Uncharacterized protein n=1 Tax=Streblomastix strix TaxID=222440 RepID=A0A5J4WSL2_9EUKA|nr:MAG: hypothetical protein EZS28_006564 [Streblomastix strix]